MDDQDFETDLFLAMLISDGSMEVAFHSNGTESYQITDICKELHPEIYEAWMAELDSELDEELGELENAGYVEVIGVDSDGELMYSLTEKGKETADIIQQAVIS